MTRSTASDCSAPPPGSQREAALLGAVDANVPRLTRQGGASLTWGLLRRGLFAAWLVVVVDQSTKAAGTAVGNTAVTHPITNSQFSLGLPGGSMPVMVCVILAGSAAFGAYVVWSASRGRLAVWVPAFLLGGAASNLADRLLFGAVRDFIPSPWVIWNLADLAVLLGVAGYVCGHLHCHAFTSDGSEEVTPT